MRWQQHDLHVHAIVSAGTVVVRWSTNRCGSNRRVVGVAFETNANTIFIIVRIRYKEILKESFKQNAIASREEMVGRSAKQQHDRVSPGFGECKHAKGVHFHPTFGSRQGRFTLPYSRPKTAEDTTR